MHIVDSLVLILVGDARKCKCVVDRSGIIAKRFSELAGDTHASKGGSIASEQGLSLFWERIADGFEVDRVVFAAVIKGDFAVRASFLVFCGTLFEPVCGAAAFAVLPGLIYASEVMQFWPSRAVICGVPLYLGWWTGGAAAG